jgi:hypothetical protein
MTNVLAGGLEGLILYVILLAIFAYILYEGIVTGQVILVLLGGIGVLVFLLSKGKGL